MRLLAGLARHLPPEGSSRALKIALYAECLCAKWMVITFEEIVACLLVMMGCSDSVQLSAVPAASAVVHESWHDWASELTANPMMDQLCEWLRLDYTVKCNVRSDQMYRLKCWLQ